MMRTYAGANALRSRAPHTEKKVRRTINVPIWRVFCGFSCQNWAFSSPYGLPPVFSIHAELLLYSENRVLCRLGDSEFDDSLGWNLDLLLRLGVEAGTCLPLLFHQLAKAGQNEFARLFDRFVSEGAQRIEEYSSGSFVGLGGFGKRGLKFCLGHLK